MIFNQDNLKVLLGAPFDVYTHWRDDLGGQGFRTLSLSISEPVASPSYTAVMVKRTKPFRGQSWPRLTAGQLAAKIDELAALSEPLRPYIIAAAGTGSNVIYAAAFREMNESPICRPNMTVEEFRAENIEARSKNWILRWIDAFGTPDDIRYCAIWGANEERLAWNTQSENDTTANAQVRKTVMTGVGARSTLIAITPTGGAANLYVDSCLEGSWDAHWNMSAFEMKTEMQKQALPGRYPVCVSAALVEGSVRFSAIFASCDDILAREFRVNGPEPLGLDAANQAAAAAIDDAMETYVRAHNFRGAAIAIVEGTRLVYAKGYTFAEPEPVYRDIAPTTLFRMGSVSKTFCAIAAWKALADDPNVTRASKMQAILNLTQPDSSPPADPRFAEITIRHLLESNSGIDQGILRSIVDAVRKTNAPGTQPISAPTMAARIAAKDMDGEPGALLANGKRATSYGRTDYFLLGLVAAKLASAPDFEAGLKKLVLDSLEMSRTRLSRTRIEDQPADEARYHLPAITTNKSVVHDDRRLIPQQYGDDNLELFSSAGGVSAAIVDLARLCAMLSCADGNPLFSEAILSDMLSDAVAATAMGSHHGYHGFDAAKGTYPGVTCKKGGSLPGAKASFYGKTGARFVMIARNGESVDGAASVDLWTLAASVDWGDGDLFPYFGMTPLGIA